MNIYDFMDTTSSTSIIDEKDSVKLYKRAIDKKRLQLKESLKQLDIIENKVPIWSSPEPIESAKVPSRTIGVYNIIYQPTGKVMSIGQGNVSNRKGRHKAVFRNSGKDITHTGGTTSGSVTAQKMYRHDNNIDNWYFSWCDVKEKTLASQYEAELQYELLPEFNPLHMGGTN